MFAEVVVDVKSSSVNIVYTYHIPEVFLEYVNIGSRVVVNFGVRKILGYVINLVKTHNFEGNVKDILDVLDFEKELTIEQVELAKKISFDTKSLMVSCLNLMYPSFLRTKYRKYLLVKDYVNMDAEIAILFGGKSRIMITKDIMANCSKIRKEIAKGTIELSYENYSYGKNKRIKVFTFNYNYENNYSFLSLKRQEIIEYVKTNPKSTIDSIREVTGCSKELIMALAKEDYLKVSEEIQINTFNQQKMSVRLNNYNFDQQELRDRFYSFSDKPFLLYSDDDEFKINLYLDIITNDIKNNKTVLIVTPTLIQNFEILKILKRKLLGYRVVGFSSDLSNSTFYDNYMMVKTGEVDVVVTTKVGVFLPYQNLGTIIVIDEANEYYLNEASPKYNLIEVLKFRSNYQNTKLLLSTSIPSIDAYYNYLMMNYYLLRYKTSVKKETVLIDMNKEYSSSHEYFSKRLLDEVKSNLLNKNVSLLILNAVKYSNYIVCKKCSKVLKCPICQVPLSYNKKKDEIGCRYCNYKLLKKTCSSCDSSSLNYLSIGLEQVKEKLNMIFPKARILQLDSDAISNYENYNEALLKIEDEQVDIVVGTNNIVSLKNSKINLIGILDIDRILNTNDYRASEMAYRLLRGATLNVNSKVIVQGYSLDQEVITDALNNRFEEFFENEIKYRERLNYPPFFEANRLLVSGDYKQIYHYANSFKKALNYVFKGKAVVLGPVYLTKYSGIQLIVKHNDYPLFSRVLDEVEKNFTQYQLKIIFERYPRSFS